MFVFFIILALNLNICNFAAPSSSAHKKLIQDAKKTSMSNRSLMELNSPTAPEVYISDTQIALLGLTISLLNREKVTYVVLDIRINRKKDAKLSPKEQNNHIPDILNFVISDLSMALELFWNGLPSEGLGQSISKRLTRKLKHTYPWVDDTVISGLRIQKN